MTTKEAEKLGYDAGLNGANTENSNYIIFCSHSTFVAWERGYKEGCEKKKKSK